MKVRRIKWRTILRICMGGRIHPQHGQPTPTGIEGLYAVALRYRFNFSAQKEGRLGRLRQ